MFERLKVRAACAELGMEPRMAKVMVHVHGLSRGGKDPQNFDLKPGETAEKRLGFFARFLEEDTPLGQELRDAKRLYEDRPYREALYVIYQEILPRAKSMNLLEMLQIIASSGK